MTPEEKKEYNRIKQAETRAKKKALGITPNNLEIAKKANKKLRDKKKELGISDSTIFVSKETLELFNEKKQELNLTGDRFVRFLLEKI